MSLFGSFFGTSHKENGNRITTVLDMITHAASLVSNADAIDPALDQVRAISANLSPGQTPSPSDTQTLLQVYLQIESYLTTKEAIRAFTVEELRNPLTPQLREQLEAYIKNKVRQP